MGVFNRKRSDGIWKRKDHIAGTIITFTVGAILYFMSSNRAPVAQSDRAQDS